MSKREEILENIGALIGGWPEEVFQFGNSLSTETDRGCALMVGAYLDSQLENLLSKRLVSNEKVQKEMFGQSGPLGSFAAKIDIAYLLGLIGPKVHRDLHLIRRVRNDWTCFQANRL